MSARFWSKVSKREQGCWEWTATVTPKGYGRLWIGGRKVLAHRYAYESEKGPVPNGLFIDHLCRNRRCVRPDHMEAVTSKENTRRGLRGALKTTCVHGHRRTDDNVYVHPTSKARECRTCRAIRQSARRRKCLQLAIARAEAEEGNNV